MLGRFHPPSEEGGIPALFLNGASAFPLEVVVSRLGIVPQKEEFFQSNYKKQPSSSAF